MRKTYKSIISLAVVLIAGLNFIEPAFAQDPFTPFAIGGLGGLSGAGLFSSMAAGSGVNISWNNNTVDQMDAMWNVLNPDYIYFHGDKHEATMVDEDIYDYIDVNIGDWLEAQVDFISNFCEEYDVTDNDTGTLSTPVSCVGIPLENINGVYYSESLGYFNSMGNVWSLGPFSIVVTPNGATSCEIALYINGSYNRGNYQSLTALNNGFYIYLYQEANLSRPTHLLVKSLDTQDQTGKIIDGQADNIKAKAGSSAGWTSGSVNTSVYDGWESARVKIPRSVSGLSDLWTIPDFVDAINNLWSTQQQGQIVIEDTDQPVPPPPVPTTPLGDVPFDDWIDLWGQGIYEQLENQSESLDFIGSAGEDAVEELESIDSNLDDLNEKAESIDTNIGTGIGLLGGIKSGIESAVDFLEGIAEHVGELVEEIVEGTETLIAGILNQIPQAFGVIFGPIKQASSIWHYVVEWIQSIGAPFQFIWSMASGTSYYIILPVYASLAAAVVLAFYKRFGK